MGDFTIVGVTSEILKGLLNLDLKEIFNTCCSSNDANLSSLSISTSKSIIRNQVSFDITQSINPRKLYSKNIG